MALKSLVAPTVKIEIDGEEWKVEFKIRNFAALKDICGIGEGELLKGLIEGDVRKIPYAIWASTLVFAEPFDPMDPLKIEKQIPLKDLYELSMVELKTITDKVVLALEAYLPTPQGATGKKLEAAKPTKAKKPKKSTK